MSIKGISGLDLKNNGSSLSWLFKEDMRSDEILSSDFLTLKESCIYLVKKGSVMVTLFMEESLEINMEFKQGECIGHAGLFNGDVKDVSVKGMPAATLGELPLKKFMEGEDRELKEGIYETLIKNFTGNISRLFRSYAAKVSLSNDQYFIDFLLSNSGNFTYTSIYDFSRLLHIDIRTLQRIMKKYCDNGMIKRKGKNIMIVCEELARDILASN